MTFSPRKGYHKSAIPMLLGFVAIGVASVYGAWTEGPQDRRVVGVLTFSMFWGSLACLSIWGLLFSVRMRLHIRQGRIIEQGVIARTEIDLPNVTAARWTAVNKGGIRLTTPMRKLTISFDAFKSAERLWLIRFFRSQLPRAAQEEWGRFCYRLALPLRDRRSATIPSAAADQFTFTRRRWDWYFVPSIALCAAIGVALYWRLQEPKVLAAPLQLVPLWLILRFSTPRQGLTSSRIGAEPGETRFLILMFLWAACAIAGIFLFERLSLPKPQAFAAGTAAVLIWLGVFFWQAHIADRQRLKRMLAKYEDAVRRWDETEP